jgi:hypothetical protein
MQPDLNTILARLQLLSSLVTGAIREVERMQNAPKPGSVKPVDPNSPAPYYVTRDGIDFDVVTSFDDEAGVFTRRQWGKPLPVSSAAFECMAHTQRPLSDFTSDCPAGYDTVLGYMARKNPVALGLIEDYAEGTRRDGFWLAARAGDRAVKVEAPKVLQEQGIYRVNAYPVDLLQRRMGF